MNYMRQMIKLLTAILISILSFTPCYSAMIGGVEYSIPIDYSKLSEDELENKASFYFNAFKNSNSKELTEEATNALNLYTILHNMNPQCIIYTVRLGIIYDFLNKDKYAKGYFSKAIQTDTSKPEGYFNFGNYYYDRKNYKKALECYKNAYKNGFEHDYDTLYKIGDIYQKFGDTEAALKYLKLSSEIKSDEKLNNKIMQVENMHKINHEYYKNTRIHIEK